MGEFAVYMQTDLSTEIVFRGKDHYLVAEAGVRKEHRGLKCIYLLQCKLASATMGNSS